MALPIGTDLIGSLAAGKEALDGKPAAARDSSFRASPTGLKAADFSPPERGVAFVRQFR